MISVKRCGGGLVLLIAVWSVLAAGEIGRAQQYDESLFKGMKWREIGPFRGGRVLAVTGIPGDPATYYFGGVGGGVWKSSNAGLNWTPVFDKQPVSSIGSLAVAESDSNVIYAGTGEACIRGNISYGNGVYKSVDGGTTWKSVGLADTRHIGRVIVDPHNPDRVFVAALGHAYGPNAERGVFRSTDGGKTWEKVLYKDEKTGAIDITFDPTNAHILFASLWEAYRTSYSLSSGGPGSGLYKSTDGGTTWKRLEGNGLPKGILGRIGVAVSGADSNRVYAQIEAAEDQGGLYRSDDGGEKWSRMNDDHRFLQRAFYYMHVFADPKNVDTVYELNVGVFRSTDGGKTFTPLAPPHGDNHGLWIDPTHPERMILGNDGGATITVDGGKTWTRQDNQPTAQFYHVIADNRFPYYVYGAQQDNTTVAVASRTDHAWIELRDWYTVGDAESGHVAPDPRDSNIVFSGGYGGEILRFDKRTEQQREISPWPEPTFGEGAAQLKHRFQWTAPILVSRHDPDVLYHAAEVLFKSTDAGTHWEIISPDLTRNDKSKQAVSGGPLTRDDTGTEYYDTIFAVAESPFEKGTLWVGADDGLVHITRDGGKNWTNITPKEMPEWSRVSLIEASPHDAASAYLAIDRHQNDDFRPYIYKTGDFGKSWNKISNGIPEGAYVRAVREDPKRRGLLYAGTETGVFMSFDDGAHWQPLQLNLPTTPIHDLAVKDDDLVAATHGRSFWILDDLEPLRELKPQIASEPVYLFTAAPAYRLRGGTTRTRRAPVGENAPMGAILDYYLKSAPKENEEITLEILDREGALVKKFSSLRNREEEQGRLSETEGEVEKPREQLPAAAGMNRFSWNLRYERPTRLLAGEPPDSDFIPKGPLALPGKYQVKLTVAGKSWTVPIEVKADPRISAAPVDLEKQFDLALKIRDRMSEAHEVINRLRDFRAQLQALAKRVAGDARARVIVSAAAGLDRQKLTPIEEELVQSKMKSSEDSCRYPVKLNYKLAALEQIVESADAVPTAQSYEEFRDLSRRLDAQLARWKEIVNKDLVELNEMARKSNIPAVILAPEGARAGD